MVQLPSELRRAFEDYREELHQERQSLAIANVVNAMERQWPYSAPSPQLEQYTVTKAWRYIDVGKFMELSEMHLIRIHRGVLSDMLAL